MSAETGRRPTAAGSITAADLAAIADAGRSAGDTLFPLVAALAQRTIGHRMFTIMRLHPETMELERVYSDSPAYPIGGRKSKKGLPWAEHVLIEGRPFRGSGPDDLRWAFDDNEKLMALGLGSVLNTPVVVQGRTLGTMNLLHRAEWFHEGDETVTRTLAWMLAPALALGAT